MVASILVCCLILVLSILVRYKTEIPNSNPFYRDFPPPLPKRLCLLLYTRDCGTCQEFVLIRPIGTQVRADKERWCNRCRGAKPLLPVVRRLSPSTPVGVFLWRQIAQLLVTRWTSFSDYTSSFANLIRICSCRFTITTVYSVGTAAESPRINV